MLYQLSYARAREWWGKDSNLRRLSPADLQSAPFGHSGTPPRPAALLVRSCSTAHRDTLTRLCRPPPPTDDAPRDQRSAGCVCCDESCELIYRELTKGLEPL